MKAFNRKSLPAAILAGLGVGAATQAGAVNIGTDNTGEVLLYPYYTVRNGFSTSLTVVNTSQANTVAAKVRFLEGKNSAEVLDFNLFLSPRDVWSGTVSQSATGATLTTTDRSCTAPPIPAAGQPFFNYYYNGQVTGVTSDAAGGSLDRTREGYVEIIEMGVMADGSNTFAGQGGAPAASTAIGSSVARAVKHAATGTPANCAYVNTPNLITPDVDIFEPRGGLMGNGIIINTTTGTEFGYVPVALANFRNSLAGTDSIYNEPGLTLPDLTQVLPARSDVFTSTAGTPAVVSVADWVVAGGQAIDAVSAVLNRSSVLNEYDVNPAIAGKTDWIVTAPTKRYYVFNVATGGVTGPAATSPFTNGFTGTSPNGRSCDPYLGAAYDREEAPYFQQAGVQFSPVPAGAAAGTVDLCWEATVLTIIPSGGTVGAASVFASANSASATLPANGTTAPMYTAGWLGLFPTQATGAAGGPGQNSVFNAVPNAATGISEVNVTTTANGGIRNLTVGGVRYRGLPLIGFAAIQAASAGQGYGGIFNHKYTTSIQ